MRVGIFFLSSIKTEATMQAAYHAMVRRARTRSDAKALIFLSDDMGLSDAERRALLDRPGILADSER